MEQTQISIADNAIAFQSLRSSALILDRILDEVDNSYRTGNEHAAFMLSVLKGKTRKDLVYIKSKMGFYNEGY